MSIRGTKYIIRRGDLFQLRLPIPKDLQDKLRRKELRRSLKTGDAPTAKRRAFRATLLFMELCDSVRLMQDISAAKANDIIAAFYTLLVQAYTPPASWQKEPIDTQLNHQIYAAESFASGFSDRINTHTQTSVDLRTARQLLANYGVDFDKLSTGRQEQIWQGMFKAYSENVGFLEHALTGIQTSYSPDEEIFKHVDHLQVIANGLAPHSFSSEKSFGPEMGTRLDAAIVKYITKGREDGVSTHGPWGETTISVNQKVLGWFCQFIGPETDISTITKARCRDFKDAFEKVVRGAGPQLSFAEAQTDEKAKRLSAKTASNQFGYLKSFFNWLDREAYIETNPIQALSILVPKKSPDEERRPFTIEELNTFFSSPIYTGYRSAKQRYQPGKITPLRDHDFWMPLLLLYTGMRLGEILNIPLSNVHVDTDIPHFDLRSKDQKLKTSGSARQIPIHPDLLELGFVNWVEKRKKTCPKLDPLMSGFKTQMPLEQYYSKRINNYIDRLISNDPHIVAHSFRHSAKDRARSSLMDKSVMDQIFGHEGQKTVGDSYGQGADLKVLSSEMHKVDFGLSHSIKSKLKSGAE